MSRSTEPAESPAASMYSCDGREVFRHSAGVSHLRLAERAEYVCAGGRRDAVTLVLSAGLNQSAAGLVLCAEQTPASGDGVRWGLGRCRERGGPGRASSGSCGAVKFGEVDDVGGAARRPSVYPGRHANYDVPSVSLPSLLVYAFYIEYSQKLIHRLS
jgi:hypothetical protein